MSAKIHPRAGYSHPNERITFRETFKFPFSYLELPITLINFFKQIYSLKAATATFF